MIILAAATLMTSFTAPVRPIYAMPTQDATIAHALHDDVPRNKRPRKFREVVQEVQYDGDYSPSATREPEPEASATTPVRYLPWWKRQIPVRVKPAPRYVDPVEPSQNQQAQTQNQGQSQAGQGAQTYVTSAQPNASQQAPEAPDVDQDIVTSGSTVGSGSATGSRATATYGDLPPPQAINAPPGSTIIQLGAPR